ncbi:AraC family transcriptional regulator [Chitinophaga silvatica]|uniref:AraC family transcriptional regulator n=1 Tax=Chitinophaga silvatica TaxID=2282649 RepID=A0A3E1Y9B3_9BACT|nr:AraC family transcriptional regulator [Chitinophaga silvatica]RFS21980.1 AraC family transcriptional regulator [Chitinophaga silvatica]
MIRKKKEGFQGQRAIVLPRNIQQLCARNITTQQLYITDIGYYPKAKFHHRKREQGADEHILIYCQEGKGRITLKKKTYSIEPGDCFLLPRNQSHEYAADELEPWTIYWAHFLGESSDGLLNNAVKVWKGHKTFLPFSKERTQLFDLIYSLLERGYRQEHLAFANMNFWSFLSSCWYPDLVPVSNKKPDADIVDTAINYMNQHLDKLITLQQMAIAVNLSQSHFSFLFKNGTGYSPIEYFNHLKVQQACQYLLFTTLRIKEIAIQLGISDPYYFSRMFTKVMGISPNQYRDKRITP